MKFWHPFKRDVEARNGETQAGERPDRRTAVRWCAACRIGTGPFVYLENGKHYCRACARRANEVMRLRPAGRRSDDLKSA